MAARPQAPPCPRHDRITANWVGQGLTKRTSRWLTASDLIKADTDYLGPRFQLMLSQLTFKLSVEKQYKDGIEKLVRLYSDDGDKKSRADAEGRRIESNQKIQLLQQALRRYESLYVEIGSTDEQDGKLLVSNP